LVRAVVFAGLGLVLAGTGCAHRVYRPGELRSAWKAPATADLDRLNYARLAHSRVRSDRIERGDLLEVTIDVGFSDRDPRTTPVHVREDGTARVPPIGDVALAGLTLEDAEQAIRSTAAYLDVLPNPFVTVEMKERRMNKVTVMGAVEEPQVVEIPRGSSYLLAAIAAAGGLSENASPDIEIRRTTAGGGLLDRIGPPSPRVAGGDGAELTSYEEVSAGGPPTIQVNLVVAAQQGRGDYYLEDGDWVHVGKRGERTVHVIGLVREPGQCDMPANKDMYLLQAIGKAKGRTMQLADKVWVIRRVPGRDELVTIECSIRNAKRNAEDNLLLAPGDVVSVEETPTTFLLDMMKSFLRFGMSGSIPIL
jgi:polysaccharide export outer membrane protein